MKKALLVLGALTLTIGIFAFANTPTCSNDACETKTECEPCPCTPDCMPGDDWCSCPEE